MYTLRAPSKTFLVGEYIALQGAPVLVINTSPYFQLEVKKSPQPEGLIDGITPDSPAGKFLRQYSETFRGLHLNFIDPHGGQGGLGASSAQFALCYLLYTNRTHPKTEIIPNEEFITRLLRTYYSVAWSGDGPPPSGADLISQMFLHAIGYWHRQKFSAESFSWPFSEHGFLVVRTGTKLATHTHLNSLDEIPGENLEIAALKTTQSLMQKNWQGFVEGVDQYRDELQKLQLVAEPTVELINEFLTWPEVVTAKGCGALGADVVLLLCDLENHDPLRKKLQQRKLEVIASQQDLSAPSEKPVFSFSERLLEL